MIIDEDDLLHFGVKGQKWGVRKNRDSNSSDKKPKRFSNKQKAAVILGSAAAATSLIVGAAYAKKHFGVSVKDIPKPKATTKSFVESLAKEPVGIVHATRGQSRGFTFPQRGGLTNALNEWDSSPISKTEASTFFGRYGKDNEKVAARFLDPLGRKDAAGRIIPHDVLLPKDLAKNVNNLDDAQKVAWPLIKDLFAPFYRSEPGSFGPGF